MRRHFVPAYKARRRACKERLRQRVLVKISGEAMQPNLEAFMREVLTSIWARPVESPVLRRSPGSQLRAWLASKLRVALPIAGRTK